MKISRLPLHALCALILTIASTVSHAAPGDFIESFASEPALSRPDGMILSPDGDNIYVSSESAVLRFTVDGDFVDVFTRNIPPDLISKFEPKGLAFGSCIENATSGCLYVASTESQSVLLFDGGDGSYLREFVTSAANMGGALFFPTALQFSPNGDLYVSSSFTIFDQVLRFAGATGELVRVLDAPSSVELSSPKGLLFGPDGHLYVASKNARQVLRYNGTTDAFIDVFVDDPDSAPNYLTFGPDGNLYVSSEDEKVRRYDGISGTRIEEVFAEGNSSIEGILFGADGDLIAASRPTNEILRFNGVTGESKGQFAAKVGLDFPNDVIFGPDGNLWVSSEDQGGILRFDGSTGDFLDVFIKNPVPGRGLRNFVIGPDGHVYASSNNISDPTVLRFNAETGDYQGPFISLGALGMDVPWDLDFGPNGHLYLVVFGAREIRRFNGSTGTLETFISDDSGGTDNPRGLEFGPDGNAYVTTGVRGVRVYDGVTGDFIEEFASGALLDSPTDLVFGPDGNLFVSSTANNRVVRYDDTTENIIGEGQLSFPNGLVFGPNGNLYVASGATDDVQKYEGPVALLDEDKDDIPDGVDLCPGTANDDPVDIDGCSDAQVDSDGDGVCDAGAPSAGPSGCVSTDDCPTILNADQVDSSENGVADACEASVEDVVAEVLDDIDTILSDPEISNEAADKLEKAQDEFADGNIKKGLKEISKAVKELLKAEKEGADVADLINQLVEASRLEAQGAIDAAIAAGGMQDEIDKALEEMAKAQANLDKGKPDKAIDHYSKAWDKAQKAL